MNDFINILNKFNIQNQDISIDCGANIGLVTNVFCKISSEVYCFEPNLYAFNVLKKNFKNNKNVFLFNKPVSNKKEVLRLYYHQDSLQDEVKYSTGMSSCKDKNNIDESRFIEIESINLISFINEILSKNKTIGILKIDIEGLEGKLLKSLIENNLHKKIKYILCETHEKKGPSCREDILWVRDYIEKHNIKNINLDWI